MEEGFLELDWTIDKIKCDITNPITGKVTFIKNLLDIKSMSISLIKHEQSGFDLTKTVKRVKLTSFEIMDGCPNKGNLCLIIIKLTKF